MSAEPQDRTDDQWLQALAGRPDAAADPVINAQAGALREAMARSDRAHASAVPEADDALLQQIRFRLRREGLSGAGSTWRQWSAWGVAAAVLLSASLLVVYQVQRDEAGPNEILRGTPADGTAVWRVPDPQARLAELLQLVATGDARPVVVRNADASITVTLPATTAVMEGLAARRLEPLPRDGRVTLRLEPATSSSP